MLIMMIMEKVVVKEVGDDTDDDVGCGRSGGCGSICILNKYPIAHARFIPKIGNWDNKKC